MKESFTSEPIVTWGFSFLPHAQSRSVGSLPSSLLISRTIPFILYHPPAKRDLIAFTLFSSGCTSCLSSKLERITTLILRLAKEGGWYFSVSSILKWLHYSPKIIYFPRQSKSSITLIIFKCSSWGYCKWLLRSLLRVLWTGWSENSSISLHTWECDSCSWTADLWTCGCWPTAWLFDLQLRDRSSYT